MTQDEVNLLLKRDEQIRNSQGKLPTKPPARFTTCNKVVNFTVNEEIYALFKEKVVSAGLTIPAVLRAAVISYAFEELHFNGDRLKSRYEASLNTLEGFNILHNSTLPVARSVGRPHKPIIEKPPVDRTKIGARDEHGEYIPWKDLDHSTRKLEDFDQLKDNIHPQVDARPMLEIDWSVSDFSGSLENMLIDEFFPYREKFNDQRVWQVEYWNYCRYCAKKFLTLNGMPKLRYDEEYLQKELYRIRDFLEAEYYDHVERLRQADEELAKQAGVKNESAK